MIKIFHFAVITINISFLLFSFFPLFAQKYLDFQDSAEIIASEKVIKRSLTLTSPELTTIDIDGNVYRTVTIGNQVWMAENLKTTRLNDGSSIPYIIGNTEWAMLTTPGYCWQNNDLQNKDTYGGLYNWYTISTGNLAPEGWHIPSEAEWRVLLDYLGGEAIAGSRLEEIGFKAQGAGQRTSDGTFNLFPDLDKYWTTTEGGWSPSDVKYCVLTRIAPSISWSSHPKSAGHSVRCIKDLGYLGQTPPGRELQRFAPGIIPNDLHCTATVSPDGQEIYWTNNSAIIMTKISDGLWTTPSVVSFSGSSTSFAYDDNPVVSPDNNKLFFTSFRPIGYSSGNIEHIWYVERTSSGWSEPQPLPQIINTTPAIHWQVSVSSSGTLYFTSGVQIYFSRIVNGEYIKPEPLTEINKFGELSCPFIAPDESYIIFHKVVNDQSYIYISFKSNNNQWLPPQRIVQIPPGISCSFVSRDGKYFFVNNHWISAEIINDYVTDVDDENDFVGAETFQLYQNYPNPFNPVTTIKYQLHESSFVEIKVYDVLGKEITTLVNEKKQAGNYEVEFDAKNLTSGIYFYRLKAGNFSPIQKMVLLK